MTTGDICSGQASRASRSLGGLQRAAALGCFFSFVMGCLSQGSASLPPPSVPSTPPVPSVPPTSPDPDRELPAREWLLLRALEGGLTRPRICMDREAVRGETDELIFCSTLKARLAALMLPDSSPDAERQTKGIGELRFAGFQQERLDLAEALAVYVPTPELPFNLFLAARLILELTDDVRAFHEGRAVPLRRLAQEMLDRETFLRSTTSRCAASDDMTKCWQDAGAAGQSSYCVGRAQAGWVASAHGENDAVYALRVAMQCFCGVPEMVEADEWETGSQTLHELVRDINGRVPHERENIAMLELRIRIASIALRLGDLELAGSWLAYRRGLGPYRSAKLAVLDYVFRPEQPITPESFEEISVLLDARKTNWATLLATIRTGTPLNNRFNEGFDLLAEWFLRADSPLPVELIKRALRTRSNVLAPLSDELGPLLEQLGEQDEAERLYLDWVAREPSARNVYALGRYYYARRDYKKALPAFAWLARSLPARFARLDPLLKTPAMAGQHRVDLWAGQQKGKGKNPGGWRAATGLSQDHCVPFSLYVLHHFFGVANPPEFATLYHILDPSRNRSLMFVRVLSGLKWDLRVLPRSDLRETIKRAVAAGFPVLAMFKARYVYRTGEQGITGHATVISGYDDALGVFLLSDVNWPLGIGEIPYAQVGGSSVVAVIATPDGVTVPEDLVREWARIREGTELEESLIELFADKSATVDLE